MMSFHYSPSTKSCYVLAGIACTQCAAIPEDLLIMRTYFSVKKQAVIKLLCSQCLKALPSVLSYGVVEKRVLLVVKDRYELPKDCIVVLPQAPQVVNGHMSDAFDPKREMNDATLTRNHCTKAGREGYTFGEIDSKKDILTYDEIADPQCAQSTKERIIELDKPIDNPGLYLERLGKSRPEKHLLE